VRVAGVRSAGILLFRGTGERLEVLLGHMGGPFFARKDDAAWSIPKGEVEQDEDLQATARREFEEELGLPVPSGDLLDLGAARQSTGKVVTIWALRGELDPEDVVPGTFEMEWPPRSGRKQAFPEIDRAAWFDLDTAAQKLVKGQRPFLPRLVEALAAEPA
jgi:predicted NUDIX family NTP pyrophosphohydrolase